MKILVLNCGSSSIKYQLFNMITSEVLAQGLVDKIGIRGSVLKHTKQSGEKVEFTGEIIDHQAGIEYVLGIMKSEKHGCIKELSEINAVGHRVAHGAEKFNSSVLINQEVINQLEACIMLAPLHNPPNLKGIFAMQNILPQIPQVGVFDTAFHQTLPPHAYMYAIPYSLYKKYGIRRYGFHGTSKRFVLKQACEMLNVDINQQKIIVCHLGNGASITAVKYGKSVDTSMGFTPVEGLVMGTRSGDVDAGVLTYIMEKEEISVNIANTLINKHSGAMGLSGISSDMRTIDDEMIKGNERAKLTLEVYDYRIKKYIGSYIAAMNGVDIIIFTGGRGENSVTTRTGILNNMEWLGIELDHEINSKTRAINKIISKESSKVKIMVIPTNEELVIAQDTYEIVNKLKSL